MAARLSEKTLILAGYGLMTLSAAGGVLYNVVFAAQVPWTVLPLFFYCFGLALMMPAMTTTGLALFPERSGLAASLQGFVQMLIFAAVSGLVAPRLFDSALKLACGVLAGLALSWLCWLLAGVYQDKLARENDVLCFRDA
jgi:DHA1 family bicyclomycin/chloramphenicol resistance-like MFS transporter